MEQYFSLLRYALEQVPALTVVAVLLYVFLKAFERVITKMVVAQEQVQELYKETLNVITANTAALTEHKGHIQGLQEAVHNIKVNCPVQHKEFQSPE